MNPASRESKSVQEITIAKIMSQDWQNYATRQMCKKNILSSIMHSTHGNKKENRAYSKISQKI